MLEIAIRAALVAGEVLRARYGGSHEITSKGLRDIATEADLLAQQVSSQAILALCPEARIVSEEDTASHVGKGALPDDDRPTWYIDPLDGTTNFARGLPTFSVSVGMARHGQVECGAVYDPLLDQMFSAARGQGAHLNGKRLHVSTRGNLMDSLVLLDWPRAPEPRAAIARFLADLASQVDAVRSRGSAALGFCSVAAGWADAYFQFTLSPWDVAAGALLVEEAGGKVSDLHGATATLDSPDWLVTNGRIHEALLALRPLQHLPGKG
ncbi:MAG: inositol monophosphatase family protein [Anaerolineae bacterium]